MHTLEKVVDGVTFRVHHNGDWSGEAMVTWEADGKTRTVTLPGMLLRACGREVALQDTVRAIEEVVTRTLKGSE